MSARDLPIDIIAQAIRVSKGAGAQGEAILAALSAAGYAIAPIDADEAMCKAGSLASWDAVMNVSDDVAAMSSIWSAMIAAAQENW